MIYWPSAQNSFFKLPGELLIPVVLFAVKIIIFMLNTSCPNVNNFKIVRLNPPRYRFSKFRKLLDQFSTKILSVFSALTVAPQPIGQNFLHVFLDFFGPFYRDDMFYWRYDVLEKSTRKIN